MADNVTLSAGTADGAIIATDQAAGTLEHYQYVKVAFGADNTQTKVGAVGSGNELPVDMADRAARDCGKIDIASLDQLPTTDYDTGAGTQTVPMIGIGIPASGGAVPAGGATNPLQVSLANTGANTNKLLVTPDANSAVNISQMNGVAVTMGNGISGTGVQRVTLASDSTGQVAIASGTVTTVSTVTNLSQMAGAAIAMGTGVRSAGTQRVTIATDDVVPASQSGTWTVQPGNTANTTPWLTSQIPATSGGCSISHLVSAATTNLTNVKASAGQLYGWSIFNTNAATRYVKLHNTAGSPTAGSGVVYTIAVPAGGGSNIDLSTGLAFSTGIAFSTVTGSADADTAAVGSGDLIINLHYK